MDTQSTTSTRPPPTDRPEHPELAAWRLKGFGLLRIAFGLVWAIDDSDMALFVRFTFNAF